MTTGKTIALNIWTFVGKPMSLLFNMLSRLVITFLPMSKHPLISWLQSLSAVILETKKIKSFTVSIVSPSICHGVMELYVIVLVFWMLSFKPVLFSPLLFHFHQAALWFLHFGYEGGVICISEVLMFLLAILTPPCASRSPAFQIMYSA